MSVGELNQLMTYVTEGWMLFSVGFIGIELVSFVSRRIQEDIDAEALALKEAQTDEVSVTEAVEGAISQAESSTQVQPASVSTEAPQPFAPEISAPPKPEFSAPPAEQDGDGSSEEAESEDLTVEDEARLEEVAAVSEQLAKTKNKQSDSPSVSVST